MIFVLVLAALGIAGAAGYMANNWAAAHALAIATTNGSWTIQAEGWASLWPTMAMGFVPGAAIGIGLILVVGGHITEALAAAREAGANEEREKWEEKITSIKTESNEKTQSIRKHLQLANDQLLQEREKALRAERKSRTIEGRLKGAQQKAERFKKKAQLTTGQAQKLN